MDYDNIPAYAFSNNLKIPKGINMDIKVEGNSGNSFLHGFSLSPGISLSPVKKQEFSDESDRSSCAFDTDGNSLLNEKISQKTVKHLTPEERSQKLQRWRRRNLERMSRETPEQREARERRNYIHRMKLAHETPEERSVRLKKLREYQKERLRNETRDERERRLTKMKEYARNRTRNETPQQREERLRRGKLIMKSGSSEKESLNFFLEETRAMWEKYYS